MAPTKSCRRQRVGSSEVIVSTTGYWQHRQEQYLVLRDDHRPFPWKLCDQIDLLALGVLLQRQLSSETRLQCVPRDELEQPDLASARRRAAVQPEQQQIVQLMRLLDCGD